jgi:hypothetical protein
MWVIRTRLQAEGIECFAQDELTVQSNNLYSVTIGGVKLQVQEHDVVRAVEILREGGYLQDEPIKSDLLSRLDSATSGIPVLKSFDVRYRVVTIAIILTILTTILLYFIIRPTSAELLTSGNWCVDRVDFNGKTVGPNTTGIRLTLTDMNGNGPCTEQMTFSNEHTLDLPGINSYDVRGYWELDDNGNLVIGTDSTNVVYAGTYAIIHISKSDLTISSKTTMIYAHKDNFYFDNPLRHLLNR